MASRLFGGGGFAVSLAARDRMSAILGICDRIHGRAGPDFDAEHWALSGTESARIDGSFACFFGECLKERLRAGEIGPRPVLQSDVGRWGELLLRTVEQG